MYIFYHPETLKIMGASNDKNTMEFPSVKSNKNYHSLQNLEIKIKNKKPTLIVKVGTWEQAKKNERIAKFRGVNVLIKINKSITNN